MHFMYITKDNFFLIFKQIFFISMGEKNIQTRFQMIDFMLYDPKIIINNLNFKLKTFTSSNFYSINIVSTNPIIPKTAKNAIQNSIELKSRIVTYQNNSLNQLYNLVDV